MAISSEDLINLPVYTASGQHLGRISSFDIEAEQDVMMVVRFYVRTGLIKGLWHEQLTIHKNQVISLTRDKMVVDDTVSRETEPELKDASLAAPVAK